MNDVNTNVNDSFNAYQDLTNGTAIYPQECALEYVTLGLVGEAGEIANKVKKIIRDCNGKLTEEKRKELVKELSDVQWYSAQLAEVLGEKLSNIAQMNIDKLYDRKERGVIGGSGDNR